MNRRVMLVGNGKHDEYEDEGANKFVEKAVCGRYIGEWVGRKEAGSFQRLLAGTAFKDVDASSVVSEDDECTQPCADDLAEDVGEGLEPREPSEDCHPEGYRGIYVPT